MSTHRYGCIIICIENLPETRKRKETRCDVCLLFESFYYGRMHKRHKELKVFFFFFFFFFLKKKEEEEEEEEEKTKS